MILPLQLSKEGGGRVEDASKEMAGLCSTRSGRDGGLRLSERTSFSSASNSSSTCTASSTFDNGDKQNKTIQDSHAGREG